MYPRGTLQGASGGGLRRRRRRLIPLRPGRGPWGWLAVSAAVARYARLYVRLMGDPRVALFPKLLVVGALAYLIAPVDLTPDFLVPVVGYLDDVVVVWLAFRALVRLSPPEVVAEHSGRRSGFGASGPA